MSLSDTMDPLKVIGLLRDIDGMQEIAHVTTFRCYREVGGAGMKEVTVEIYDHGPEAGFSRYHCIATTEDGKTAMGNPGGSLEEVIAMVHWGDLDRTD